MCNLVIGALTIKCLFKKPQKVAGARIKPAPDSEYALISKLHLVTHNLVIGGLAIECLFKSRPSLFSVLGLGMMWKSSEFLVLPSHYFL